MSENSSPHCRDDIGISYYDIPGWLAHVNAGPLAIPKALQLNSRVEQNQFYTAGTSNSYKLISELPIRKRVLILERLWQLLGTYDTQEILQSLPCPTTKPLVSDSDLVVGAPYTLEPHFHLQTPASSTFKSLHSIEAEYRRILNVRDTYWVWQLTTEDKLRNLGNYSPPDMERNLDDDIRTIVSRADEAATYTEYMATQLGWDICFSDIDQKRCANLSVDHPLRLIQECIEISTGTTPLCSDDDASSSSGTFNF